MTQVLVKQEGVGRWNWEMCQGQLMDWKVSPNQLHMAKMCHLASLRWALCSTQIIILHCGWGNVLYAVFAGFDGFDTIARLLRKKPSSLF